MGPRVAACLLLLLLGCGSDSDIPSYTEVAMKHASEWAEREKFEYDAIICDYAGDLVECRMQPKNPLPQTVLKCSNFGCMKREKN